VNNASPRRSPAKLGKSLLADISADELRWLRFDEASEIEFNLRVQRYDIGRAHLHGFRGEDSALMTDARHDELLDAESSHSANSVTVVHFLAPRILRMREGPAKRKWRSLLTKFQKEEGLI
jgi:hypothetical protein